MFSNRRDHPRVQYPDTRQSPTLTLLHASYQVLDVSEWGLYFTPQAGASFALNQTVNAYLTFTGGLTVHVEGVVIRIDQQGVALALSTPLPPHIINGTGAEQRAYFRLKYPPALRPALHLSWKSLDVCEISEYGLRFRADGNATYHAGEPIRAVIEFKDHESLTVTGTILRLDHDEVVVRLDYGIPANRVMSEQRHVIRQYREGQ